MTYATQLLHLDDGPRMATHVELAARLSRRFEGHVVALSASGTLPAQVGAAVSAYGSGGTGYLLADLRKAAEERAQRFSAEAAKRGLTDAEVIIDDDEDVVALVTHARCSDLVILGQPDPAQPRSDTRRSALERTLLGVAPPCLLVPYAGDFAVVGTTALVAWNDSLPCTRAIIAALPFLREASTVHLMQCDVPRDAGGSPSHPRLEAAATWLRRHGVHARASVEATEIDFGNALLSRAADLGVDLIVAGAWSHSRLGEHLFGGVTRTLLDSMTIPVLMAH